MNFITIPLAGDNPIGPSHSGRVTIVSPDADVTVGYMTNETPPRYVPYTEGLVVAGGDGVFNVGIGTVIAIQTPAADTLVGIAGFHA